MQWYHIVALIFISLMPPDDAEQLFIAEFLIHISLMKCLLDSFASFLIELLGFLLLSFENSLCFGYKSFIRRMICKYFLPLCGLSFHSVNSVLNSRGSSFD